MTDARKQLPVLQGMSLHARAAIAAGLLLLEKVVLNLFIDSTSAQVAHGLGAVVRITQHWGFRFLVSFAIATAVLGYLRGGRELAEADTAARTARLRFRWLALHGLLVVPLVPLSMSLYSHATRLSFPVVLALWLFLAVLAVAALLTALAPWSLWRMAARAIGSVWWYAGIAAAGSVWATGWSQTLWTGMAEVTFEAVYRLLAWFVPTLRIESSTRIIDTGHFAVAIDPVCSGIEGMGLMLAFCTMLLMLFRKEYIFPRALILIPAGLLLSFALNVVRIAALVLIGSAGYSGVAVYGFHSQAGWIAFNAAAVGIALVSLRSGWLTHAAAERCNVSSGNPAAVYLLPFLALLLAGMVSRALSSGFESLYWLRLVAAGLALCYSWPRLHGLDWRCSWRGPLAGLASFGLWIVTAHLLAQPAAMPPALAALPPLSRASWVAGHLVVSLGAVPIAEELAFRGYLLRRIAAADFESLPPRSVGTWPLLLSSLAFGLCHGALWLPGMIAGVTYGLVFIRSQRMGEAIAAHATANALIAGCVLVDPQWQLW
jgi:exosortase E/protease (VPEID-CTERM system)